MSTSDNLREVEEKISKIIELSSSLLQLMDRDFQILKDRREILQTWAEDIAKAFYHRHTAHPETLKLIENLPKEEFETTLKNWYIGLLQGKPDIKFWLMQWFIALDYLAKGVPNAQMASLLQMTIVQMEFGRLCFQHFEDAEAWVVYESFKKITTVVNALVIEGYMNFYKKALENMAGLKTTLVDRIVYLESKKMLDNFVKYLQSVL